MIGVLCALLAAGAFYLSIGLGTHAALAWLAPLPVLWFAFGPSGGWRAFALAFAAYAAGQANVLPAYGGQLPPAVVLLAIAVPARAFALAVAGGRAAFQRFGPLTGIATFASLWAGLDFALSLEKASGSVMTPAASQLGAPVLEQAAALVGFFGVTFVLGAVAAALALALRRRSVALALAAAALFAANWGFGAWRLAQPASGSVRVALLADDALARPFAPADRQVADRILGGYARAVARVAPDRPALVIAPENLLQLAPGWRDAALQPLAQAAAGIGATLVVGVDTLTPRGRANTAAVLAPGAAPLFYSKRRLVPGLETGVFRPGSGGLTLADGTMVAICKDLDFPAMIRRDVTAGRPRLMAVPAWDFGADGRLHARVAMLRSIENGVPLARSARDGMLTLSDRYGRLIASAPSGDGMTVLVGDLPIDQRAGTTPYSRIGDVFGYAFLLFGVAMAAAARFTRRARRMSRA
jgi:apolipoprotein N-acyltransferase